MGGREGQGAQDKLRGNDRILQHAKVLSGKERKPERKGAGGK